MEGFAAYSPYLINGALFRTVEGVDVSISTADDGSIFINGDASIVTEDIVIANGVVHVIDKVCFCMNLFPSFYSFDPCLHLHSASSVASIWPTRHS